MRTCIHVGAHHAQEEYPGYATVWWIEADPSQWPRLEHLKLVKCAAMDYDGTAQFHRRNVSMASSVLPLAPEEVDFSGEPLEIVDTIEVPCYKLDTLFPNIGVIDLLVIDVEGAELHVLRGGVKLLERTKEVKIELLPRLGYPTQVEFSGVLHEFELLEKCPFHEGGWYDLRYRRT